MKKILGKAAVWMSKWLSTPRQVQPLVAWTEEDVWISHPRDLGQPVSKKIRWESLRRAVAFKKESSSTDQVSLLLEDSDGNIEINEDMQGWGELLDQLPNRLPGFPSASSMLKKVVFSAMGAKNQVVWERKVLTGV